MSFFDGVRVSPDAPAAIPRHLAIIMDGNGRWAQERSLRRLEGHRAGGKTVRMIVEESRRLGIRYLTLFSFSTENWLRPEEEVSGLMSLFLSYLESEVDLLLKNQVRLRAIGDLARLPAKVRDMLNRVMEQTRSMEGMDLVLAVSYGGRDEIVSAARTLARRAAQGELNPDAIDAAMVGSCLYAPDIPDPDLLLRTSNEFRISNFLLWQLAYTEIVVSPLRWPEFSKDEFYRCLSEFAARDRRFGLTGEQLAAGRPAGGA